MPPQTNSPTHRSSPSDSKTKRLITFLHPDLGIGGAERLILDAALALQNSPPQSRNQSKIGIGGGDGDGGHPVTIYTSHRDERHCFEEARDGTLDVRVRGAPEWIIPPHVGGRFVVALAVVRQILLVGWVVAEGRSRRRERRGRRQRQLEKGEEEEEDEVFIVDQVPACVPILRLLAWFGVAGLRRSRILFYCHFPDQLLSRRNEGGAVVRLVKACYRVPFDALEGWAMSLADKVVANSKFTRGVVGEVFGRERMGDVRVVYPCVDTDQNARDNNGDGQPLWGGMKILLSINRFERKKNIELAIRAYHGLPVEDRKGTRLVIAGGYDHLVQENAQYHRELVTLATSLGLQTATSKTVISALSIPGTIDVLFLLSVPSAFKQTLLSSASLLLYTPSQEHFGIVPVEAMHAGLPVLAVNTGGPLETIIEGKTGWLRDADAVTDWTDVMRNVLCELAGSTRSEMGRNGRERVEKEFSRHAMGERLEEEIDEMFTMERKRSIEPWQVFAGLAIAGLMMALLTTSLLRSLKV